MFFPFFTNKLMNESFWWNIFKLAVIFAVEFAKIRFCDSLMIVRRKTYHGKSFFCYFVQYSNKHSQIWCNTELSALDFIRRFLSICWCFKSCFKTFIYSNVNLNNIGSTSILLRKVLWKSISRNWLLLIVLNKKFVKSKYCSKDHLFRYCHVALDRFLSFILMI